MNKVFTIFCLQLLKFTCYYSKAKELGPIWVFILVNECVDINNMILNTLTGKDFWLISHPLWLLKRIVWHVSMSCNGSTLMTAAYKINIGCLKKKKSHNVRIFLILTEKKMKLWWLFWAFRKWWYGEWTLSISNSEFTWKVHEHKGQLQ